MYLTVNCKPKMTFPLNQIMISYLKGEKVNIILHSFIATVFSQTVSAETITFWKWKIWKFIHSFRIMAIFYFINLIVATETIEWGNYWREETIRGNTVHSFWTKFDKFGHSVWRRGRDRKKMVSRPTDNQPKRKLAFHFFLIDKNPFWNQKKNVDMCMQFLFLCIFSGFSLK